MYTKIILEFGCNHNGDINIARRMIDDAANLKVFAVKFQKRDIESMPDELKIKKRAWHNSFGNTYYEHRKALEFDNEQLDLLKTYAESKGLVFSCSAFDLKSIDDLISIGCNYIKLPSQLYSDETLKEKLIKEKKSNRNLYVLVSTGMHEQNEIFNNSWINNADVIFHCISIYPHTLIETNMKTIHDLKELSNNKFIVGYSSHEVEGFGVHHAVMAGAEIIERHYTLDKKMKGSDHSTVSSDYMEIERIIYEIAQAEKILGDENRLCSEREKEVRLTYRGF